MIRYSRKKKLLTQKQLANLIGVSQSTVSRLENNIGNCNINLDVLVKISNVLDICPMTLLLFINPAFKFTCIKCDFSELCVIFSNYKG